MLESCPLTSVFTQFGDVNFIRFSNTMAQPSLFQDQQDYSAQLERMRASPTLAVFNSGIRLRLVRGRGPVSTIA